MTATTEQLLALLRDVCRYAGHLEWCDTTERSYLDCNCGWKEIGQRVEDALANHPERPESSSGDDDGN